MLSAKNLTNVATCHTVWKMVPMPKKANCGRCTTTDHSSDPALKQAVDGLRRIIHQARTVDTPPCRVNSDPTAPQTMGRFLLAEVNAR
jgi:hypothetical protein